jgi:hypothetical protein
MKELQVYKQGKQQNKNKYITQITIYNYIKQ